MKWIITGGAGFIGCNAGRKLREAGHEIVVFDNLSRVGGKSNLEWLGQAGDFEFVQGDVRDAKACASVILDHCNADVVLHLAGQVAVTTSVADPRFDFEVNALGTFNLCEAVRSHNRDAILLYSSTNKVYGELRELKAIEKNGRYAYEGDVAGIAESQQLDFHSPYGCSKGAADQYVIDFGRIYGLRTVAFRQSCIYGPRQFGVEDQGWLAWFLINAARGSGVTIYGDGKQVRDVLFVDDLVECYIAAVERIDRASGNALNVGGGAANSLSLLELISLIKSQFGVAMRYEFADWRPGDQKVFVSDISKAAQLLDWHPRVTKEEGISRLFAWITQNIALFTAAT